MLDKYVSVIIPAGGQGTRMKAGCNKQYLLLNDIPVLTHAWRAFARHIAVKEIILVVATGEEAYCWEHVVQPFFQKRALVGEVEIKITPGGKERQHSVYNGLKRLDSASTMVAVHDGARPLIDLETINRAFLAAETHKAAIVAVPVKDTIKKTINICKNPDWEEHVEKGDSPQRWEMLISETLPRDELVQVQTPQVFQRRLLQRAYDNAFQKQIFGTDDSALVEGLGEKVAVVPGHYHNLKITTWEDLVLAREIIKKRGNKNESWTGH